MTDTIAAGIRDFIIENFLFGDATDAPGVDDSLLQGGVIDSTGVLQLVFFIEDKFGVDVGDGEIVPANFDSISRLVAYVSSKQAAKAA